MLGTKTIKNRNSAHDLCALKEAKITTIVSDKKTPALTAFKGTFPARNHTVFNAGANYLKLFK